ncbi:MAG: hypothetical protein QW716_00680 [Desulfurococcaceae archaeon]
MIDRINITIPIPVRILEIMNINEAPLIFPKASIKTLVLIGGC